MPATELGLTDVEERLRSLSRRMNTVTVVHGASLCLAAILLSVALRIALGPQRFSGGVMWLALVGCTAAAVWAAVYVRQHWLSQAQAARLVDRQAELSERVTTLFELAATARGNRLLPMLLMQALDLGERWQPQRLVPRPYPRSVYLVAAALLALAASPLIEPALPPLAAPPSPASTQGDTTTAQDTEAQEPGTEPMQVASLGGNDDEASAGESAQETSKKPPDDAAAGAKDGGGFKGKPTGNDPGADAKAAARLAAMPESLRRSLQGVRSQDDGRAGREPGDGPHGEGERQDDDRKGEGNSKAPNPGLGKGSKPNQADDKTEKKGAVLPAPNAAKAPAHAKLMNNDPVQEPQGSNQGSSPGAGVGSQAANLLTVRGGDADASAATTGTFKLTLSSFLNAIEDKSSPGKDDNQRESAATADSPAPQTVSERQKDDDALRKASIPPEYEEIMKRVYSRSQRP